MRGPLLVALTLLALAPLAGAQQTPLAKNGEEVEIRAVAAPALAVAEKTFELSATLKNKADREIRINLVPTFYAWSPEKSYPCGNQNAPEYRGSTTNLIAAITLPAGATRTYPDDVPGGAPWFQQVRRDWVADGEADYELCVTAVEPGTASVAPTYHHIKSVKLRVRAENAAPEAAFTWDPLKGNETHPVTFRASGKDADGDRIRYEWDFGHFGAKGRATATGGTVEHAFYPAGKYAVTLTATDGFDATRVTHEVEVLPESAAAVERSAAERLTPGPGALAALAGLVLVAARARRA